MEGALILNRAIDLLRAENSLGLRQVEDSNKKTTVAVDNLHKTVGELLEEVRNSRKAQENSNRLLEEERRDRENEKKDKAEEKRESKKVSAKPNESMKDMLKDASSSPLAIIAAVGAALTGLVVGFLDGIRDSFKVLDSLVLRGIFQKTITPRITTFFNLIGDLFTRLTSPITRFFDAIGDIFRKAGTGQILKGDTFKVFGQFTVTIRRIADRLSRIIKPIRNGFDRFIGVFTRIAGFFRTIGRSTKAFVLGSSVIRSQLKNLRGLFDAFRGVSESAKGGSDLFSKLGKIVRPFFNVFRRLGRFLGGPITVAIFAIVDSFIGAFKGFKETEGGLGAKIFGAIGGAFSGVVSGFVGGILDLGKMAVGFIAGLFGFDDFKEKLKSFSFQEIIFDGLMFPFRAVLSFFDGEEGNMFSDLVPTIVGGISNIFGNVVGFIAEKLTSLGTKSLEVFDTIFMNIAELLGTLINMPYDMVINAIGWLMDKLGFEGIAERLKEFSLNDIFVDFADNVLQGLKNLIRSILPDKDSFLGKLVPDAVYEYLDTPPPPRPQQQQVDTSGDEPFVTDEKREELEGQLEEIKRKQEELERYSRENQNEIMNDPGEFDRVLEEQQKLSSDRLKIEKELGLNVTEGRNEDVPRVRETVEPIRQEQEVPPQRERPERPDFTQRQMATAQLQVSDRERRMVEQQASINAVDASQQVVNNNNVSNNQTGFFNPNMPAVDNLDRSWGW